MRRVLTKSRSTVYGDAESNQLLKHSIQKSANLDNSDIRFLEFCRQIALSLSSKLLHLKVLRHITAIV